MRLFRLLLITLVCAAVAACGNKGPLVVPDKQPQTQPAQPDATPAVSPDSGQR
jgi:predicted small lipoprotein YifL